MALVVKNSTANAGYVRDGGSIPGSGKSLQEGLAIHSMILAWRIAMDRGPWRATVQGVAKSQIQLKWLGTHACKKRTRRIKEDKEERLLTFPVCLEFLSASPRQQVFISGASSGSTRQFFLEISQTSLINPLSVSSSSGSSESLLCRTSPPNF